MSARRGRPGRLALSSVLLALAGVLLTGAPAAAGTNPVLDTEGDTDLAESLAEATDVQGVCYGYALRVSDADTGAFSGSFASSSAGAGRPASAGPTCPRGVVLLSASISYTSSYSESEDSASWTLQSSLPGLTIRDVENVTGSDARGLLDDAKSEDVLLNAVLALPGLATERAGVPALVLDPVSDPAPGDARATGTPGSDWTRENGSALLLCGLALVGAVAALVLSRRRPLDGTSQGAVPRGMTASGPAPWPRPGGDPNPTTTHPGSPG